MNCLNNFLMVKRLYYSILEIMRAKSTLRKLSDENDIDDVHDAVIVVFLIVISCNLYRVLFLPFPAMFVIVLMMCSNSTNREQAETEKITSYIRYIHFRKIISFIVKTH